MNLVCRTIMSWNFEASQPLNMQEPFLFVLNDTWEAGYSAANLKVCLLTKLVN